VNDFDYVLVILPLFHDVLYAGVRDQNINLAHLLHLVKHFVVYDVSYLHVYLINTILFSHQKIRLLFDP
jgi:hypothetical protein